MLEEFRRQIREYVEKSQEWRQRYRELNKQPGEENTKFRHIAVLLQALGWDIHGEDVDWEYAITERDQADATLCIENTRRLILEIKPFNFQLKEANVSELVRYCRVGQVDWGMLTNGREIQVYHREWQEEDGRPWLLFKTELDSFGRDAELLWLLSREAIGRGTMDEVADDVRGVRLERRSAALRGIISDYLSGVPSPLPPQPPAPAPGEWTDKELRDYLNQHRGSKVHLAYLRILAEEGGPMHRDEIRRRWRRG